MIHNQEGINREVLDPHKSGFRIVIHGNGDREIGSNLDEFEQAITDDPREDHRHQ